MIVYTVIVSYAPEDPCVLAAEMGTDLFETAQKALMNARPKTELMFNVEQILECVMRNSGYDDGCEGGFEVTVVSKEFSEK